MHPKSFYEARKVDFLINRVFAPHFRISYRVRGRTYISASQIESLIVGDSEEKKRTRRTIIRENSRKKEAIPGIQKTLFDRNRVDQDEIG